MQPNLINLKNQALALISQVNDKKELDRIKDFIADKGVPASAAIQADG